MENNVKVFGISVPECTISNIEDLFDLHCSMDEYEDVTLYESKKTYAHDCDPEIEFNYKYFIEAYQDPNSKKTYYHLFLVVMPESLCADTLNRVKGSADDSDDLTAIDSFYYGASVVMAKMETDSEYDKSIMDKIASICDMIDSLRGFYLDQYQNRIGNTGWDYLERFVNGKKIF